jgi:hypothetical protein
MGVKMGSLIMASNGELIPYREFKKKKLEQNFEQGKKDPLGKSLKNKPPAEVVDKDSFDFQKKVKAAKKAIAEYPEKMKKRDRMIMRQYKKDDLALRKVYRAAGRAVPFVSKALGAIGSLIPTRAGSAELKDMKNKKDFLTGGQAKIDKNKNNRIDAEDFKILREENKKKKGGVTSAIKKIRGIGMAKGGFKKKTPIY